MIIFKGCPRCRGDMVLQRDPYGRYLECLQCGNIVEQESERLEISTVSPVRWPVRGSR